MGGVGENFRLKNTPLLTSRREQAKANKKTYKLCISATDCNGISVTERSFRAILRGLG